VEGESEVRFLGQARDRRRLEGEPGRRLVEEDDVAVLDAELLLQRSA
jgi:hypothetical protein